MCCCFFSSFSFQMKSLVILSFCSPLLSISFHFYLICTHIRPNRLVSIIDARTCFGCCQRCFFFWSHSLYNLSIIFVCELSSHWIFVEPLQSLFLIWIHVHILIWSGFSLSLSLRFHFSFYFIFCLPHSMNNYTLMVHQCTMVHTIPHQLKQLLEPYHRSRQKNHDRSRKKKKEEKTHSRQHQTASILSFALRNC